MDETTRPRRIALKSGCMMVAATAAMTMALFTTGNGIGAVEAMADEPNPANIDDSNANIDYGRYYQDGRKLLDGKTRVMFDGLNAKYTGYKITGHPVIAIMTGDTVADDARNMDGATLTIMLGADGKYKVAVGQLKQDASGYEQAMFQSLNSYDYTVGTDDMMKAGNYNSAARTLLYYVDSVITAAQNGNISTQAPELSYQATKAKEAADNAESEKNKSKAALAKSEAERAWNRTTAGFAESLPEFCMFAGIIVMFLAAAGARKWTQRRAEEIEESQLPPLSFDDDVIMAVMDGLASNDKKRNEKYTGLLWNERREIARSIAADINGHHGSISVEDIADMIRRAVHDDDGTPTHDDYHDDYHAQKDDEDDGFDGMKPGHDPYRGSLRWSR